MIIKFSRKKPAIITLRLRKTPVGVQNLCQLAAAVARDTDKIIKT